jgi:hypothetical protein
MIVASIGGSVTRAFVVFFAWLPALVGAIAVLVIGYFVAKLVAKLVSSATHRAGLDRTLHSGPGGTAIQRIAPRPSRLLGTVVFWAILLSAISLAASVLHIKALTAFVGAVWGYLPNVIAAFAIFVVAGLIATAVAALAKRVMGDTGLGRVVATGVPILVMTIATFMILNQLKIAPAIVTITYAALLGAIALGSALAFGLGGRDVAARMLEGAYSNVQQNKGQWKRDLDQGLARARDEAASARDGWSSDGADGGSEGKTRVAQSAGGGRYAVSETPASEIEH